MKPVPWVFVTGAPLSGATLVGKMLSFPRSVDYIHEPFNPDCGIPGLDTRFLWSDGESSDPEIDRLVAPLFDYRIKLRTGIYPEDTWQWRAVKSVVGSRGPFHLRLAKLNRGRTHVVLKDPIGLLLTEYLANNCGVAPVIMVRHPIAVVAGYKRRGWVPRLDALRGQPELCERYFPYPMDLRSSGNVVQDAAYLWRALHVVLLDQLERNPDWAVVRHEDMITDPVTTLRSLYEGIGLPWSARVARRVHAMASGGEGDGAKGLRAHGFECESVEFAELPSTGLWEDEVETVLELAGPLASRWYGEKPLGLATAPVDRRSASKGEGVVTVSDGLVPSTFETAAIDVAPEMDYSGV